MNYSKPRQQRGAALIVGLVLLMVLTVLGISGMTTARLEVAMADNMQRGQYAFQSAQSAVNAQMRQAPGQITLNGSEVRGFELLSDVPFDYKDTANATIATALVDTTFQGYIDFGESTKQVHYESRAIATTPSRGAQSIQRAGYFVLAPN